MSWLYAAAGRFSRGGVWAPGGPRGLQNRRGRGSRPGGFDSRPPPLYFRTVNSRRHVPRTDCRARRSAAGRGGGAAGPRPGQGGGGAGPAAGRHGRDRARGGRRRGRGRAAADRREPAPGDQRDRRAACTPTWAGRRCRPPRADAVRGRGGLHATWSSTWPPGPRPAAARARSTPSRGPSRPPRRARGQQQRRRAGAGRPPRSPPGREIVISRGELIEIGDGFRLPDLLVSTGARLREVGTTNRTTLRGLRGGGRAGDRRSSSRCTRPTSGSRASPRPVELAELAGLGVPVVADIGSGPARPGAAAARRARRRDHARAGADLVTASGDKLLGGPQAGLLLGRRDLVERLQAAPARPGAAGGQADPGRAGGHPARSRRRRSGRRCTPTGRRCATAPSALAARLVAAGRRRAGRGEPRPPWAAAGRPAWSCRAPRSACPSGSPYRCGPAAPADRRPGGERAAPARPALRPRRPDDGDVPRAVARSVRSRADARCPAHDPRGRVAACTSSPPRATSITGSRRWCGRSPGWSPTGWRRNGGAG